MPPPLPTVGAPVLSPEHLQQLMEARMAMKRIRTAIIIANIDGWTLAALAGLTCLGSLFSVTGMLMGLAMGAIAFIELRSAAQLRRLQPAAARRLGYNQVALATLLILYAASGIYSALCGPSSYDMLKGLDPEIAEMLKPVEGLVRQAMLAIYLGLILFAVGVQGGTAWYYFTRTRHIRTYLSQTPGWIIQMQQAGFPL